MFAFAHLVYGPGVGLAMAMRCDQPLADWFWDALGSPGLPCEEI